MSSSIDFSAMISAALQSAKEATDKRYLEESNVLTTEKARAFMGALKLARSREQEGEAILAFVGEYSRGLPHGQQLDLARMNARKLMNNKTVADNGTYSRCSHSVGGYVAGMPDPHERMRACTEAQLREAIAGIGVTEGAEENARRLRALLDSF